MQSFIESQFPVSKLSKESYKERKAVSGQTLTGLGKWWGRKPLVLVRALILGLLLPATDDPRKDREIFLKLMTMDSEGLRRRRNKSLPVAELFTRVTDSEQKRFFIHDRKKDKVSWKKGVPSKERDALKARVFESLSYDEKLEYCLRPEQIDGLSPEDWAVINAYLDTRANNLAELVREMGQRRFGHPPRIGDAFCGGGSIPFEAVRLGCEAYGSDLNPVAGLLTWGALNIVGGGPEVAASVADTQRSVFEAVDRQVKDWGIEHNEEGWRADAYIYCAEAICPECGWRVPLAPSWVVAEKTNVIGRLRADIVQRRFDIEILEDATAAELKRAKVGTALDSDMVCPNPSCRTSTSIASLRGEGRNEGPTLRPWEKSDIVPRPHDVFQERLYCVRWVETFLDSHGDEQIIRHYRAPTHFDLALEQKALDLLQERFSDWQVKGYIPTMAIESGDETTRLLRERGWTYWHHLFNPRQLLLAGLFGSISTEFHAQESLLLLLGRIINNNSKLSRWKTGQSGGIGGVVDTYSNQALNTLLNYGTRPVISHESLLIELPGLVLPGAGIVSVGDARSINIHEDIWITDPPYADAVNYHELSEYFLAWYAKRLTQLFPDWYADSKRVLAIQGSGDTFRQSMMACYKNLAAHMPDEGLQVVMFTHQDAAVWADLALILWAAGLRVTAAWTIATETESAMKKGNYVQGTVLLVLRKQTSQDTGFLDDVMTDVRPEVERQLQQMLQIDDKDDPNFSDSDYQLAAYAAALRVLTQYASIQEIDPERELNRPRSAGETSQVEAIIEQAVKVASNFLVPTALHDNEASRRDLWRNLAAVERFYLKGLDVESRGEMRQGVYQEFARGFGLNEYTNLLQSGEANATRLKTASEFKNRDLGAGEFAKTLLRQVLFAVAAVRESEKTADGLRWLHDEVPGDYWALRHTIASLLRYLSRLPMPQWTADADAARILAGAVENDGV